MATQTRERNYRKHPHTARFLMAFHAGAQGLPADIEEDNVAEYELAAEENGADLLDLVEDKDAVDLRTPGQVRFMDDLVARLTALDPATGEAARAYTERGTREGAWTPGREGNASKWIDRMITKEAELKAQGRKAEAPAATEVPNGRYAVEEDGTLKFFHVRNGKAGTRWEGFVFIDIQASADLYPLKDRARKARILALIAQDVEGALCRYGQELGVCGDCGRTLTDETSRSIGRGPICRSK